jgi:hypothetical protein
MGAGRLIREARTMQSGIEPVSRAVTGEYAPGAVCAVSSRCKTDDCDCRCRVAKAIERPSPVVLAPIAAWRIRGALLAPLDQAWA